MPRATTRTLVGLVVLVTVLTLVPGRARADDVLLPPSPRQGYFLSLGYAMGSLTFADDGDRLGPWFGGGTVFRVGQMLTRRLGMGLTVDNAGAKGKGEGRSQTASFFGVSIEGQFAPTERLAILGGVGIGVAQLKFDKLMPDEDSKLRGNYGAHYMLGASYDFFPYRKAISGGLAVSPALRVHFSPGETVDTLAVMVGADVTWWTGLPRNQLDLPPDKAFER